MIFKSLNSYFCFLAPLTIIAASAALTRLFSGGKGSRRIKWAAIIAAIVFFGFFDFFKFAAVNKQTVVQEYYFGIAMEMPRLIKENDDISVIAFEDQNLLWSVYSYILRDNYSVDAYNANSFINAHRIEPSFINSNDYFMVNIPETNKFLFHFKTSSAYDEFRSKYYGSYWMMRDTPTYNKSSFLKDTTSRCATLKKSRDLALYRCVGI